ncbi:translocase of chloroplast 159, chloroplastic-like [Dorcoceras hygrometricum]|uniref:Translocase of chloroplast 159, chloroplastic-like n=1 Tax=Dorcoceras hygrometricum TaxID=472368 RepID=A0A2Z7AVU9_9LAMI|nr:translocase of chloroplast 159, chloroplastic-like [Dorcoceras hygrometricum]
MASRFNGVSISSSGVPPKAALSSGIRAPLTVDETDFEYSASSKSRRNSTTSSYYSGSEPESEGFASGEDEGVLEDTHYVEEYNFSRPFMKNPNGEKVQKVGSRYEDVSFRPSVTRPWRELVEESGRDYGNQFGRALVRSPNDRSFKGFGKVNEYEGSRPLPSDSDEEIFEDEGNVLGNGEFRPVVAAANEDVSETESSSVVDIEISLMPKLIIPIAKVTRDSDDDSQASEVMDDDGFMGVARVPSIEGRQRYYSTWKFNVSEIEEEEAHKSLAQNVVGMEFVEELVVDSDCLSSKQEDQTIDGVVAADLIQNKGNEDSYEVSAGSFVSHEEHESLFESGWNGNLMPLHQELKELDGEDERQPVGLDNRGLPTDPENTPLPGNFPCDVTAAEPICEIVELIESEIPELDNSSGVVEVYVDCVVSDKDIQSGNLEQECEQKLEQTETRTSILINQDVQMSNAGPSEGCPQSLDLPEAFTNDKHVNQGATHKEENGDQLYGEAENPNSQADVYLTVSDMKEKVFTPCSDGEILQQIDGLMVTGSVEGVNSDDKFSDSADLAGHFIDNIGVVSDGDMNHFTTVEAREGDALPRMNCEAEKTLSEAQKHKVETIQQLRVKYLQLLNKLGMFPENSVAAKVIYQLAVAEARSSSQKYHFDSDKKAAKELEVQSKNDIHIPVSILVIGKTGVGKSATINSMFGERKTVIDAFEPATTDVKEIIGMIDEVKVKIFDTPGLRSSLEDQSHNRKVLSSIKKIMQKSPPDVVIYIDRLDTLTNSFDDLPLMKLVTTILGPSIWQKAIISFTHSSSIPPDGSDGDAVSYEVFVYRRSYSVQQMIGHAGGEFLAMNPGLMIPVALVENHTSAGKREYGKKTMHTRESWRSHLLLLCYSMKILSDVNSLVRIQDPLDGGNLFGFNKCSPFEDDTSAYKEMGISETIAATFTDIALPPFLDGNNGVSIKIQLHSSVPAKPKHKRSTMARLDVQTSGVSITFVEDQITVGERPTVTGAAVSRQMQTDAASGANTEGRSKGSDYPIVKYQSSLGLSLRNWRSDVTWGCNLPSQFSSGRNSRFHVRVQAGRNKKPSWQVCIRTSSSDQLQIAVIALLPVAKVILRNLFPRTNKNST